MEAAALSVALPGRQEAEGWLQSATTGWHHSRYGLIPGPAGKCSSALTSQWEGARRGGWRGVGRRLNRKRVMPGTGRSARGRRRCCSNIRSGSKLYGEWEWVVFQGPGPWLLLQLLLQSGAASNSEPGDLPFSRLPSATLFWPSYFLRNHSRSLTIAVSVRNFSLLGKPNSVFSFCIVRRVGSHTLIRVEIARNIAILLCVTSATSRMTKVRI